MLDRDEAFKTCIYVTTTAPPALCKWAFVRLGHEYLRKGLYSDAVQCGQTVMRVDDDNALAWELLGDGYAGRGAYVAALRAFQRALELNDDTVYCSFRIASIHHVLGNLDDAINLFSSILVKSPKYIPALQGAGEVRLSMANRQLQDGLSLAAAENIVIAIGHAVVALQITSQFQCIWKLLGDICNASHQIPWSVMAEIRLPDDVNEFIKTTNVYDEKDNILRLGGFAFLTTAKYFEPALRGTILGDLALNFLFRSRRMRSINIKTSELILPDALAVIKQSVRLLPRNSSLWNILGVIALELKV